ncbi:hypothetical protein [Hoeflea sp. TYP-13]|uniref:hypothetical protein n=1 Tax=Hoeflea sp. TYP-13 TaxID=3230023 RepID=UPI0034C5D6AB
MMVEDFFRQDSLTRYMTEDFFRDDRDKLEALGGRFLTVSEANEIHHQLFFDSLISSQESEHSNFECLPRFDADFVNNPIPFDVANHEDHSVGGKSLEAIVKKHVKNNFAKTKYLFSGDPRHCFALQFEEFTHDILWVIYGSNLNTPFILFDKMFDKCFNFHFDLNISIYSRKCSLSEMLLGGKDDAFWTKYFNKHFVEGVVTGNDHHLNVINNNYVPRLPGVQRFSW